MSLDRYRYYIAVDMTGKQKGNHELTLQFLEGPFVELKEAKEKLAEMDNNDAFVVEGKKNRKRLKQKQTTRS